MHTKFDMRKQPHPDRFSAPLTESGYNIKVRGCWQFLFAFLLVILSFPAAAQPLTLANLPSEPLGKWIEFLPEDGAPLSLEEVRNRQRNGLFRRGSETVLTNGIGSRPLWVHLELLNPEQQPLPLRLQAGTTWIDRLDVFVVHDGHVSVEWHTGDTYPNPQGLTPGVGFTLTPNFAPGLSDLYIRAESIDPMVLPIRLMTEEQAASGERWVHYGYGFLYGYLLALIAYNGMIFAGLRERSYLYYSLYLAVIILLDAAYTGHGGALLWPEHPALQRYIILFMMVLYGCCGLLFACRFLALKEHAPQVQRLVRAGALSMLALILLCIAVGSQYWAAQVAFSFIALFSVSMVLLGILTVRHGRTAGRYFLLAVTFGMLGAASSNFSVWGWIPFNTLTYHGFEFGILVEATLLALALAHRFNEMNTRLSVLTVSRDGLTAEVAERKRAEEMLRTSEESLRESQLAAGLGSYALDIQSGQWKSSGVLDQIFGIDESYPHTVEGWQALLHPDNRAAISDYFLNEVLAQNRIFDREYRIIRHNDQVERWVHGLGRLKFDTQGRPLKMHGTIQDLTERKLSEIALRQREEEKLHALNLLKVIADGSTDAIFAKDMDGRYLLFNREALRQSGRPLESIIGKGDEEIYPPETALQLKERDKSVMLSGNTVTFEEELVTVDGKRIFLTTKGPMKDTSGNTFGIFGISHDITKNKKAEQALTESMHKLEEKELAKSRFLAAAGHDLRQPLAAANLFIDALKFTEPNPEQTQIIQRLDQSMSTFNGLLDALLNVSKLDAGMIKPEFASIDIADIFNWIEQSFTPLADEKNIGFKLRFPTQAAYVHSDIGLLKSVLMNLISNAIKFTSKGSVLVCARQRGNEVLFQVWDTGSGIPQEQLGKIFEEFYQVDNPQRDRTMGLGLGLSIAKRALVLLGRNISCRSRLGHGSVFEFSQPLVGAENLPRKQEAPLIPQASAGARSFAKGKRFMVVEDDTLVSEALSNALIAAGGKVKCFHSAEYALQHSHIESADYYIADYMLGSTLNGIQFLGMLRQRLGKPIKAVIMTGDTSPAFVRESAKCDWPILHKPVNITTLLSSLSSQEGR